jgi:hypothetical protein
VTAKKFRKLCEDVSNKTGIDVTFYKEDKVRRDAFHDDGTLHVQDGAKLRACFDVGQDNPRVTNIETLRVMDALGMEVTCRVLVEESNEDDEYDYFWTY